ncbi:hypothetical protein Tco_0852762 [Tanacetum coccineum]
MEDEIFFNQSKYIKETLKKFGLEDSKPTKTPMSTKIKLTKDDEADFVDSSKYQGTRIETVVYADSDHAGDYIDRKSTSGVCTFMGCCLTSWFAKKQTALAISTTKAEYVSAGKAYQQALWMKQALIDYSICLDDVPIMCDNKGAIDLSKNPVKSLHKVIKWTTNELKIIYLEFIVQDKWMKNLGILTAFLKSVSSMKEESLLHPSFPKTTCSLSFEL